MSTTHVNGRERKSLAEQLDRLDLILDGLAEGLNEAVVLAVQQAIGVAVKEAVQVVLTELLTNPAVVEHVCGVAPPPAPPVAGTPKPGVVGRLCRVWGWIGQRMRALGQAVGARLHRSCQACVRQFQRARQRCAAWWSRLQVVRHFLVQVLMALGVGVAVGTAAYCAGPWLAASVGAAGGLTATRAGQAGRWLRRLLAGSLGRQGVAASPGSAG
jgi:hypothetical protein